MAMTGRCAILTKVAAAQRCSARCSARLSLPQCCNVTAQHAKPIRLPTCPLGPAPAPPSAAAPPPRACSPAQLPAACAPPGMGQGVPHQARHKQLVSWSIDCWQLPVVATSKARCHPARLCPHASRNSAPLTAKLQAAPTSSSVTRCCMAASSARSTWRKCSKGARWRREGVAVAAPLHLAAKLCMRHARTSLRSRPGAGAPQTRLPARHSCPCLPSPLCAPSPQPAGTARQNGEGWWPQLWPMRLCSM